MQKLKTEFRWAIYYTFFSIVWFQFEKKLGFHDTKIGSQTLFSYLFYLLFFVFTFFCIKVKKKLVYQNQISFQQGLVSGSLLAVFCALMSPFALHFKIKYIHPEFFPKMIAFFTAQGKNSEQIIGFYNFKAYAIMNVVEVLSFGIIFAFIVAKIVENKKIIS
jgi:Protein of unknown function (DUF4199)